MICHACQHEIRPFQELQATGRLIDKCPRAECGATQLPQDVPAPRTVAQPEPTPADDAQGLASCATAEEILTAARQRLAEVREMLGRLEALTEEERVLEAIIAVADRETRCEDPSVTALRREVAQ